MSLMVLIKRNGLSKADEQEIYNYLFKKYRFESSNFDNLRYPFGFSEKEVDGYLKVFLQFSIQSSDALTNINFEILKGIKARDKNMVLSYKEVGGSVEYFKWLRKEVKIALKEFNEKNRLIIDKFNKNDKYCDYVKNEYFSRLNILNAFLEIANIGIKYPNIVLKWS